MATTVAEVSAWMQRFAPRHLAETWDNVGLLSGDPAAQLQRIMTCLTVTGGTAAEAIADGAGLILTHHPILFRPIQQLRADRPATSVLWDLTRAGVAVYSPHTALDNTRGGINDGLAQRLGLVEVRPLRPSPAEAAFKVVVFVPDVDHGRILTAAFDAGAGRIGLYDQCSFTTEGLGTFFGAEGSNPAVGQRGRRETVAERRVEFIAPADRLRRVLEAIHQAHPTRSRPSRSSPCTPWPAGGRASAGSGCSPNRPPWGRSPSGRGGR